MTYLGNTAKAHMHMLKTSRQSSAEYPFQRMAFSSINFP